jgi:hypothetical protein
VVLKISGYVFGYDKKESAMEDLFPDCIVPIAIGTGVKQAEFIPIFRETYHGLLYGTREVVIVLRSIKGSNHIRIV